MDEFYADMQTEEQPLTEYEQLRESLLEGILRAINPEITAALCFFADFESKNGGIYLLIRFLAVYLFLVGFIGSAYEPCF